ncbi:MAG: hypothetical protein ACRC6V_19390 [Bacteroidales bacterium]
MEHELIKEVHSTKIKTVCECCGKSILSNSSAKKEKWCSFACRKKLVKSKKRPSLREPTLRDMVDKYYEEECCD